MIPQGALKLGWLFRVVLDLGKKASPYTPTPLEELWHVDCPGKTYDLG